MPKSTLLLLSILLLFACKTQEKGSSSIDPAAKKELNRKQEVAFGRIYIDASKEKILGNFEKAAELFQQAIQINPQNAAAHYELGLVFSALKNNQNAFEEFKIANQIEPDNYWYKLSYASFLEGQGRIDEAIGLFKSLAEENPSQLELKYELAKLLLNSGKARESIKYLNLIEDDIGVNAEISGLKQRIYLSINEVELAAQEIEKLIQNDPQNLDYYTTLVNIYLSNGKEEEAQKVLLRLEAIEITDYRMQFNLAKINLQLGNREKYQEYIKAAFSAPEMDIDQKVKFLLSEYQVTSKQREKIQEGIELASIMTEAHPNDAKSHALLADYLYFADRDEEAIDSYRKTVDLDSSRFPVWNQLLVILSENQKNELLLNYAPRAIELFPNQPSLYFIYGLALSAEKEYQEAVDYLELGKDLVVDNQALKSQFYSSLGDIYHELGNDPVSDQNYDMALKLDPNNIYVLNNYSYYLSLRKENLEKAREMSLKSNQISPGQSSFQDTYAWILFQMGDYKLALEWINKALDSNSSPSGTLLEHKGDILFKLGRVEEALEFWEKAKASGQASESIERKISEKQWYE